MGKELKQAGQITVAPTASSPASPSTSASVNERLIAGRIATLLGHYWTPEISVEVRSLLSADWLADLRDFAAPVVAEAVDRYRRGENFRKRPMPGDIRHLCLAILEESKPPPPLAIPDQRHLREMTDRRNRFALTAADARDAWAREHGCADFAAVMSGPGIVAAGKRIPRA